IQRQLHARAREEFASNIVSISSEERDNNMEEIREAVGRGIVSLFLCDNESCGKELEDTLGASVLGEVYEYDKGVEEGDSKKVACAICGRRSGSRVLVARTY
ncbi:MAG: hypothetical protein J7I99_06335, partial [Methanophagales archaeon]|nr:hypothetical protein [Methanophagales archaeon]